jgi:hypothetical protein
MPQVSGELWAPADVQRGNGRTSMDSSRSVLWPDAGRTTYVMAS